MKHALGRVFVAEINRIKSHADKHNNITAERDNNIGVDSIYLQVFETNFEKRL